MFYLGLGGHVGGRGGKFFRRLVWTGCHERSLLWLLIALLREVLWWLRAPQLVAGFTIPRVVCGAQGGLKINMRKKGELTGSYSLRAKLLFFQPLRFPFDVANALCKLLGSFLGRLKDF